MDTLKQLLPEEAKDLRLNLAGLARVESLTPEQLWGTLLASAIASRNAELLRAVATEARPHLSDAAARAARTAAELMGMNNVYYRFTHLVSNGEYRQLPARLRMQGLADPGVDKLTFELWCLAVSAIHGCGACLEAHESEVKKRGASAAAVQDAVRVAAVVHAAAMTLDAEQALSAENPAF
jgi:alkyl hydroperoxide reductase subunit D